MNISITHVTMKANARKLVPLSEHKGPFLDLMFYEKEKINLLTRQMLELENQAREIIRTVNINKHLTGYQINKCKYKLFSVENSINNIREQIYLIKKARYDIQKKNI